MYTITRAIHSARTNGNRNRKLENTHFHPPPTNLLKRKQNTAKRTSTTLITPPQQTEFRAKVNFVIESTSGRGKKVE